MSVTFDYFFNANKPLRELAAELNGFLGCSLAPYEGDVAEFYCRFLSMEFTLDHHDLENDRDLNFKDFTYCLGVRIPSPDNDLLAIATQTMVSVAYVLHIRLSIHKGMLVREVQTPIAK